MCRIKRSMMCCFCCTSLRGTVYYMVTVHMIATFYMFLRCLYTFFNPPEEGYPDLLDINPMIVSQLPLLMAGYAFVACVLSCFIYRAVDMDSVIQMKWSAGCFAIFQFIIILNHFIFTVMFVDILTKGWQAVMVGMLVANFLITITYLCVLFIYGKKLHYNKFKRPKQYRNSFHQNDSNSSIAENNANAATVLTLRKEPNNANRMNVNLLENHVTVTSVGTETSPAVTFLSPVGTPTTGNGTIPNPPPSPPPPFQSSSSSPVTVISVGPIPILQASQTDDTSIASSSRDSICIATTTTTNEASTETSPM